MMLQNTNHNTPFDYEIQLDIYYFKKVWRLKEKLLKGDTLKSMTSSLGTEIDLLNIMWLYRSKKYFSSPSFASYDFIIPICYKLTKLQMTKLIEAATIEEMILALKSTHYENIGPALADGTIEVTCHKIIAKVYQDNKSDYPSSMAPVNNYLYQKQSEINRLTTALECIRYKLEPQDTLRYVL
jgi:V/A-type H+-transporting ATPase subunit C